ncbi:BspA family leucine-rich repeat surface protein [Oceanivirga salmonicida]|uniref:BspA family leucine-rich repeat surface protein n=1 Tax=Oceanivirga salmonicida TaxID=1769291 RepID=UPI0008369FAD|nr:BspA family leucine-rich repeat surface protein [Oceanivirga salmonicida]
MKIKGILKKLLFLFYFISIMGLSQKVIASGTIDAKIHYEELDSKNRKVYVWNKDNDTQNGVFSSNEKDDFGRVFNVNLPDNVTKMGLIFANIDNNKWSNKDCFGDSTCNPITGGDRFIDIVDKKAEIWVIQGMPKLYNKNEILEYKKTKAKEKNNAFTALNNEQKKSLNAEVDTKTELKDIAPVNKKADELNNAMNKLKIEIDKLNANTAPSLETLKGEVKTKKDENLSKDDIDALIKKINEKLQDLDKKDIGEVPGTVFLKKIGDKYIVTGNGKINKEKFRDETLTTKDNENITIELKDAALMFPDDSSNLFNLYRNKIIINKDISTSNVTNMAYMFSSTTNANPDTTNWDTSKVTDMQFMFYFSHKANPNVEDWNTENVTNMKEMFMGAKSANPNVSSWNTSKVTDMSFMFRDTLIADPDVSNWDVKKVKNMSNMFYEAKAANPNINNWEVGSLTECVFIFNKSKKASEDPRFANISTVPELKLLIKGDTLEKLKIDKKAEIDKLTDLNQAQKEALKKEVDDATDTAKVNEVATKATDLNTAMTELKAEIDKLNENKSPELDELKAEVKDKKDTNLNKADTEALTKKIKDKLKELSDKDAALTKLKIDKKAEIDKLSDLNQAQKDALKKEVDTATDETKVNEVVTKATDLNTAMTELKAEADKLDANPSPKLDALKTKVNDEKVKNLDKAAVEALIKEIKDKLNEINVMKIELSEYAKEADAFYYTDTTIADRVNENTFFDINFSKSLINVLQDMVDGKKLDGANIIGGVQIGANHEIKKDLILGGFAEYQNKVSHNVALGINVKYKDFLGFARYRIATKDSKLNHNVDIYGRYSKLFKINKLELEPRLGVYLTYSSKVKLAENVDLKARVGVIGETSLLVAYNINRAKIYVEPKLAFGYNDQKIVQTNLESNEHKIKRSYVDYSLRLGAKYKFINNVSLDGDINVKGDMNKNIKVGTRIGVAYSW